eukprot:CAMPEP_0181191256 /NCGR_PEP_ID=MMETSP1096-20121128/12640_1 /TAXON_ID=156174 ORGANISM="Chrysochromulina ericina, Strain CCMP281" /NCGR_SAMPLE_ID=MMETSP1096 /ASSEMBLY_ACC=CAM_ASM_000453 /LENGTH=251 /DNA_ID=CAMNT_0023280547 /DNA_START=855 /DNA_END=1609 /DNA_ORIENTATION=+
MKDMAALRVGRWPEVSVIGSRQIAQLSSSFLSSAAAILLWFLKVQHFQDLQGGIWVALGAGADVKKREPGGGGRLFSFLEILQSPIVVKHLDHTLQKMSALRTTPAPMSEEMTFYRQQRAQLFALGIIDYDDQSQTARRGERRLPPLRDRRAQEIYRDEALGRLDTQQLRHFAQRATEGAYCVACTREQRNLGPNAQHHLCAHSTKRLCVEAVQRPVGCRRAASQLLDDAEVVRGHKDVLQLLPRIGEHRS